MKMGQCIVDWHWWYPWNYLQVYLIDNIDPQNHIYVPQIYRIIFWTDIYCCCFCNNCNIHWYICRIVSGSNTYFHVHEFYHINHNMMVWF
jgi:hypothetical protein